jgi:predicted alpha/beta hydrolase family esterase
VSKPANCRCAQSPARLLIIPGLHDSPPEHWQSWLQSHHRDAVRVVQRDWCTPDLERWPAGITSTLAQAGGGRWIAVAHSFGVLALVRHLALDPEAHITAALLVAPADPDKFGLGEHLPAQALPIPATMVLSQSDPWLAADAGRRWAARWGCHAVDLGDAGHINASSGHRTLPLARRWVVAAQQRLARESRHQRVTLAEWSFAV